MSFIKHHFFHLFILLVHSRKLQQKLNDLCHDFNVYLWNEWLWNILIFNNEPKRGREATKSPKNIFIYVKTQNCQKFSAGEFMIVLTKSFLCSFEHRHKNAKQFSSFERK